MTALHKQLLGLLDGQPSEVAFEPEASARLLESLEGKRIVGAMAELAASQLALVVLRALAAQRDRHETEALSLELVATMPGFRSAVARDTETAVLGLVQQAARQLIVVGYELTNPGFEQALHAAGDRGVQILVITDRRSKHGPRLLREWPQHLPLPRVYRERVSDVNAMAKMHGKALLADGQRLYVSSANFTWLAMNANIELGVLLQGRSLEAARVLFEELLLESRLLERVQPGGEPDT